MSAVVTRTSFFRRLPVAALGVFAVAWGHPAEALELTPFTDKAAHFGLSYVLVDQLQRAGVAPEVAAASVVAVGLLKELADGQRGAFDVGDLVADVLGAVGAGYLRYELAP